MQTKQAHPDMMSRMTMISRNCRKITILQEITKLLLCSILRCNLSKFITQTGLHCSKQLENTFHQFCEKPSDFGATEVVMLSWTILPYSC